MAASPGHLHQAELRFTRGLHENFAVIVIDPILNVKAEGLHQVVALDLTEAMGGVGTFDGRELTLAQALAGTSEWLEAVGLSYGELYADVSSADRETSAEAAKALVRTIGSRPATLRLSYPDGMVRSYPLELPHANDNEVTLMLSRRRA